MKIWKRKYIILLSIILFIVGLTLIFTISPFLVIKTDIDLIFSNFNLNVNLEIPPLIALLGGNIDLSNINEDPFSSFLVKTFIEGESINFDYITLIGLIITIIGFILIFILWNKKFLSLIGVVIFIIGDVLIGLEGFNFTILNKEFLSETINFLGIDILLNGEIIANGSIISSIIFVFIPLFSLINLFINIYNKKYKRKEIKST